ncbi:MAG TPA: protein phosphatase 2C domain-containing protein [Longimicrobiales bacterium]|nr:protein phosphatase 2C domain-containing protein [Longimicrobiales bacterium]
MVTTETATGWRTMAGRRAANQDAVFAGRLADGRELLAVADGMGGHKGGEVASQRTIETVVAGLQQGHALRDAVRAANDVVRAAAQENPAWEGMGTTLVALLRSGERYQIANVGDSRAYLVNDDGIRQLTADHSFMAEALAARKMSAEEVKRSRWRNALTRAIGTEEQVEVDMFGPFDVSAPHVVLLCSDGLHGAVSDEAMRRCVSEMSNLSLAAERLANEAYGNGSKDNISVAIMRFGAGVTVAARSPQAAAWQPKPTRLIIGPEERHRSLLQRVFTLFT